MEMKKEPKSLEEIFEGLKENGVLGIWQREGVGKCYVNILGQSAAVIWGVDGTAKRHADVLSVLAFRNKIPFSKKYIEAYKEGLQRLKDEGYQVKKYNSFGPGMFSILLE